MWRMRFIEILKEINKRQGQKIIVYYGIGVTLSTYYPQILIVAELNRTS